MRVEDFMSIPKIAAIIAFLGFVGLVTSSLAHAGALGDVIFNASAVCLVIAPLIVLGWFINESRKEVLKPK
jgi:hypothetical protein